MIRLASTASFDFLRQRWLFVALALFFTLIYTQYALKLRHSEHGMRSAFLRWRSQLAELDDGVNIWEKHAYPNPPMMALILMPFTSLSPTLGATLWFCCKAILALAAILGVLSLLDTIPPLPPWGRGAGGEGAGLACASSPHPQPLSPTGRGEKCPFPLWGKAVAVLASLRPLEGDLVHGNVNLLILFLIVASLLAFCQRRDLLAGLLLGLGIACKLTPALFLLYFLWKRAWTALFGSIIGLIVFGLFIPGLAFGWNNNLDYLKSWHEQMIAPYAAGVVTSEHKNQSLPGLAHRLLSEEASFSEHVGEQKIVLETHNLVSWNRAIVQGIILACMALYALLATTFCRTSMQERPRLQMLAEFSVIVLGMLLFCERTWKHHGVTLLLPFCVLGYCIAVPLFSRTLRWSLGVTLALCGLLMLSTSTGIYDQNTDANDRLGKLAQVYGAYVWVFLLLLTSMFVVLRRLGPSRMPQP